MANKLKLFLVFCAFSLLFGLAAPHAQAGPDYGLQYYTPTSVVDSVYMIKAFDKDLDPQWSGTGFKIGEGLMLTAGHVCDTEGQDGFTFRAIGRWNKEYPVQVIKFSRDPDLCLLQAKYVPGPWMNAIAESPAYATTLWYSGAPHSVFGDGTVPFARGYYIGGNKMMIAGYPGASGSPVYNENGVVGVLVAGWRGTHLIVFEPVSAVQQFLKE